MSGQHFVVFGLPGTTPCTRFGITATKKFGHAVARNRIKRVVREIVRNNRGDTDAPIDFVVNIKAAARDQEYERLAVDLTTRLAELRRRLRA